jgi:tRNA wybutosine-synthesizing protein 2
MIDTPFNRIKKLLANQISPDLISKVPNKWEQVGNIVTIVILPELEYYKEKIGEVFAEVLNCRTVLRNIGGIRGELRKPDVEIIFGPKNTVTIHKENGIKFKLDLQKIMFSSGNMNERIRMANISTKGEVVADLFAGIGYFSLPLAVHGKSKRIYSCEKNPVSYKYLCENIVLNNVTNIVEPLFGDNREIAPTEVADRIIMGYIGNSINFIPTAFNCLKNSCGIIHFHDKFPDKKVPEIPMEKLNQEASKINREIKLLKYKKVKSYAPGVSHFVFDIKVSEK